jgi:hypothetical protein
MGIAVRSTAFVELAWYLQFTEAPRHYLGPGSGGIG